MEKTLKMGAFQALDSREMMEVEGGYTFLCKNSSDSGRLLETLWNIINPITVAY